MLHVGGGGLGLSKIGMGSLALGWSGVVVCGAMGLGAAWCSVGWGCIGLGWAAYSAVQWRVRCSGLPRREMPHPAHSPWPHTRARLGCQAQGVTTAYTPEKGGGVWAESRLST